MVFRHGLCLIDQLPVGYRFSPTDQELATFYLKKKVSYKPVLSEAIKEMDADEFYSNSPVAIVGLAGYREREWYFSLHYRCQKQYDLRKDRIEMIQEFPEKEENEKIRIVGNGIGYWRSSGKKEFIYDATGRAYAFKIHFIYFSGPLNGGKQTHWRWEEYHLITSDRDDGQTRNSKIDEWVLGRITRGRYYTSFM